MTVTTGRTGRGAGPTDTYPQDELFGQLADATRRRVLDTLSRTEPGDRLDCVSAGGGDGSERTVLRLHHVHLPKLGYAGYVDWDPKTGTVARGPEFESIEPALHLLATNEDRLPGDWC